MINFTNNSDALRNEPVNLTPESVLNPYLVLEEFFYPSSSLPKYRKWLETWMIAGIKDKHKWTRDKLVHCIYKFWSIAALLDALWIIHKKGDRVDKEQTALRGGIDTPYYRWSEKLKELMKEDKYKESDFTLYHITVEEELDPMIVITLFYQDQDLYAAKEKLGFWCHTTIANSWEYASMDKGELFTFYEQLLRVLEAVFVIVEVRFLMAEDGRY